MTFEGAGNGPGTTARPIAGAVRQLRLAGAAGIVLSAVVTAGVTGGSLDMGSLGDVVTGVLLLSGGEQLEDGDLAEVVGCLAADGRLERRGDAVALSPAGLSALTGGSV